MIVYNNISCSIFFSFIYILYHTNYNMNANSSKALYFIKKISRKYDVDFFYDSVNLSTKNFESQARIYRYKKLNHLSQGKKIDFCFLYY